MKQSEKTKVKEFISWPVLALIMLVAIYLRLKPAIIRPIIFDEGFTITFLIKQEKILDLITKDPSIPPLNYLLIKFMSLVSTQTLWLRIPSVIFSLIGLFISFKLAKNFSYRVAFLTLIMLTFSAFQIAYSWQAYVYSQLFFLGMSSIYIFFLLFTEINTNNLNLKLVLLIISSLLAFITHYGFIWTILAYSIIVFFELIKVNFNFKKTSSKQKKLLFGMFYIYLGLIAYFPIFIKIFDRGLLNIAWLETVDLFTIGENISNLMGFFDPSNLNNFLHSKLNSFLWTVIIIAVMICLIKARNKKINFLIIISLFNLIAPIFFSLLLKQSIVAERAVIVSSATLTILFSIVFNKVVKEKYSVLLTMVFIVFYIFVTDTINSTKQFFFQPYDLAKHAVDWFRNNKNTQDNRMAIFVYDEMNPFPDPSFHETGMSIVSRYVFDYYWQGYDGKKPLPEYEKIESFDDIKKKTFYFISVLNHENDYLKIYCNNDSIIKINKLDSEKNKYLTVNLRDQWEPYIYECRP